MGHKCDDSRDVSGERAERGAATESKDIRRDDKLRLDEFGVDDGTGREARDSIGRQGEEHERSVRAVQQYDMDDCFG